MDRVGSALALVGVEEGFGTLPCEDACQLPGEVVGVAQACAEALADEGRGEVGCVSEEEDAVLPPAVGDLCAEGVPREADHLELFLGDRPRPWRQKPQEAGAVGRRLFGVLLAEAKLPAVAVFAYAHVGGGSGRIADLVDTLPGREGHGAADVDDEPVLRPAQEEVAGADGLAGRARGAVTPQHGRGDHGAFGAGGDVLHADGRRQTGAGGARVRPRISVSPCRLTRGSRLMRSRRMCSRSGWSNMLAWGKPWAPTRSSRRNRARTRCRESTSCIPRLGRLCAAKVSAAPTAWRMRMTSSST